MRHRSNSKIIGVGFEARVQLKGGGAPGGGRGGGGGGNLGPYGTTVGLLLRQFQIHFRTILDPF